MHTKRNLNIRGRLMRFDIPKIMGIVNATPDSFYTGSRNDTAQDVLRNVRRMANQGVDILDVGGASTRPGADPVDEQEEIRRLDLALSVIRKRWPDIPVSVDTFRASVARHCVRNWQVDIINDISGGTLDNKMFETVAELGVAYVLMHMRGNPQTMQQLASYTDVTAEVLSDLAFKIAHLNSLGVRDIIIDPGFGFAKTTDHNYRLLAELRELHRLNMPLLVGISRKSLVYNVIDTTPDKALNGTTVLNTIAIQNGADILRVHDVAEAAQVIKMMQKLQQN